MYLSPHFSTIAPRINGIFTEDVENLAFHLYKSIHEYYCTDVAALCVAALGRPLKSYRGLVSERSGALSDDALMSLNSEPLVSHSLWKLYSLFLLVGERAFIKRLLVLSGRKNAKSRERITDPAPNRNGAPDTMVCKERCKSSIHHITNFLSYSSFKPVWYGTFELQEQGRILFFS